MYCTTCGKEIEPGARFCNHCGAPIESQMNESAGNSFEKTVPLNTSDAASSENAPVASASSKRTPLSRNAKIGIAIGVVAIVVLVIIALVFLLPNQSQDNSTPTESETKTTVIDRTQPQDQSQDQNSGQSSSQDTASDADASESSSQAVQLLMRIANPQLKVIPSILMGVLVIALRILITILFPMFQKMDQGLPSKITTMTKLESMYGEITILREKHSMSVS